MKLTTHLIDVSEDPAFFDPEMPFGTDIADGDDYQVIIDTPEIGSGPNITAGGSAVSVSGLINAITAGPSTTTSSVSSTTAVMPFVATASLSAVAVTPAITTNSSIYFFPYPHVGGLNPSGVSLQDSHIQRQNPYQPILIQECQKEILTIDTKQCCQVQPSLDCNQLVHHRYGRVCGLHGVDGRQ